MIVRVDNATDKRHRHKGKCDEYSHPQRPWQAHEFRSVLIGREHERRESKRGKQYHDAAAGGPKFVSAIHLCSSSCVTHLRGILAQNSDISIFKWSAAQYIRHLRFKIKSDINIANV